MADYILPVVVALIAAVPGIAALVAGRSKNKADAASTLTGAALQMVNELQEQAAISRDVDIQKTAEIATLRAELAAVKADLLEQGVVVATMKSKVAHLEGENKLLRQRVQELESENVYLRQQFEKVTGRKIDTGPLKKIRGES